MNVNNKFKDWQAISKIPDKRFMHALALLNISDGHYGEMKEFVRLIVKRLPKYFVDQPQRGPIPKSVIVQIDLDYQLAQGYPEIGGKCRPVTRDLCGGLGIPIIEFGYAGNDVGSDVPVPMELRYLEEVRKNRQWEMIEWEGAKLIVLEDDWENCGIIALVPAECIDLTC